jgi:hypothetical protein
MASRYQLYRARSQCLVLLPLCLQQLLLQVQHLQGQQQEQQQQQGPNSCRRCLVSSSLVRPYPKPQLLCWKQPKQQQRRQRSNSWVVLLVVLQLQPLPAVLQHLLLHKPLQ